MPTMDDYAARFADELYRSRDIAAERRTAISAAEEIMNTVLGYLPDEPGDARIISERIKAWLARDVVKNP